MIKKAEIIVCTVMILVIKEISPPSCLARIKELGAVGINANKTKIEIIISFNPKNLAKIKIKIGRVINLAIELITKSFFELPISFKTKA